MLGGKHGIVVFFRLYRIIFRCQCLFYGLHPDLKMVQHFPIYSSSNYVSFVEHLRLLSLTNCVP